MKKIGMLVFVMMLVAFVTAVQAETRAGGLPELVVDKKTYPKTTAVIEGHTDNVGTAEYNQKLSDARANSVRQYLINNFGIKASRLTAVGYGLTKPIASNNTEEGRQENRRVQAVIKAMKKN